MKEENKINLKKKIKERAEGGKLPCAQAFVLAEECNLSLKEVRKIADELEIKIVNCQLGCF